MTGKHVNIYTESAKFLQNLLLENNIKCFLIGGSLINSIRDNGILKSDDIDFAVLTDSEKDMEKVLPVIQKNFCLFTWKQTDGLLSINVNCDSTKKIDFFRFVKKNLNYYMYDLHWIHERINHFQTFKNQYVVLEDKSFLTMYRPDLFLKTVYGDYSIQKNEYKNLNGGDTKHLQECVYYVKDKNSSKIDFRIENLKNFFNKVIVKNNISAIDENLINVFDDEYIDIFQEKNILFYKDFRDCLILNKIKFDDF